MKYQTEYQRNYQPKVSVPSVEERRLNEVPFKRSPSRRRGRSVPSSPDRNYVNENFAVMGPTDKLTDSRLYRLKQPVKDYPRAAKSQEYALLGRNEKFENNVVYPLRRPVISNSPRVVVRKRKKENHSCGIQTDLAKTTSASSKRDIDRDRRQYDPQSEYRTQYFWRTPAKNQIPADNAQVEIRSDTRVASPVAKRTEKTSVAVNTPARVEIDVNKAKPARKRTGTSPSKASRPRRDETSEYRRRYKPPPVPQYLSSPKRSEPKYIPEQKPPEIEPPQRAYSDDEGISGNVELGNEFRKKYPHGRLRRWKSEYQSTYKPFWRFDYKNGKWYKDNSANEKGFNPDLFWYKELMSTRQRANEYRANAETDHFNPQHTLQLQTGFSVNNNCRAWDIEDDDDDSDSVVSVDRDLERERLEGQHRRERDAKRDEEERKQYTKPKPIERASPRKTNQVSQTDRVSHADHQVDRVVYIDEPPVKQPSAATKAFVRNLGSSSVQQHMNWESDSLNTQRTGSDVNSHRRDYTIRIDAGKKQESRGTRMHSPLSSDRQQKQFDNSHSSSSIIQPKESYTIRPSTSYHGSTTHATGRPSYDLQTVEKRPQTSSNQYCTYPASRFKDEVTEYYYGGDDNRRTPVFKPSFQNHVNKLDDRYEQPRPRDDDVFSNNSARSLSSSCSLASQTLERAQQNMNKYWGDHSPKKVPPTKH